MKTGLLTPKADMHDFSITKKIDITLTESDPCRQHSFAKTFRTYL
jgi:hypothetical protein